jgi:hypothetical protein
MEQWAGRSALDEYQSRNVNRVRQQMAAVYRLFAEQKSHTHPSCQFWPAADSASARRLGVVAIKLGNWHRVGPLSLFMPCVGGSAFIAVILNQRPLVRSCWLIPDTSPDRSTDDVSFLTKRTAVGVNEIVVVP